MIGIILLSGMTQSIGRGGLLAMAEYEDQYPFAFPEFAENPEPRCPYLLLLDTSRS